MGGGATCCACFLCARGARSRALGEVDGGGWDESVAGGVGTVDSLGDGDGPFGISGFVEFLGLSWDVGRYFGVGDWV